MKDELSKLADRVESLTGPCYETNGLVAEAVGWTCIRHRTRRHHGLWVAPGKHPDDGCLKDPPMFTRSIDAAMSLVPEGWTFDLQVRSHFSHAFLEAQEDERGAEVSAQNAATPALALTAAALKARAEVQP